MEVENQEVFYKNFVDSLVGRIPCFWYDVKSTEGHETYFWSYLPPTLDEFIENKYKIKSLGFKSYEELAKDVMQHLKIVK
jgi:hypothetical protein